MKLLLQIGVLAGVCYQAFAALPQIPDGRRCNGFCTNKGEICSKLPPGLGWSNTGQICDPRSGCTCWTRAISPICNGRCNNKGERCSKMRPGKGWSNTGNVCDEKNGCTCWKNDGIKKECHDDKCKAMGGICKDRRPPGFGWWIVGRCKGRCLCWKRFIIPTKPTPGDLDEIP